MAENILQEIVRKFREPLDPIAQAAGDPAIRREILLALNLDPNQASQPLNIPPSALASIDAYTKAAAEDVDLEAFASVVEDILGIGNGLKSFIDAARAGSSGAPLGVTLDQAVSAYLNMLTLGYVRVREPGIYIGLRILGLIEEQSIRHGGLFNFLTKMGEHLKALYGDSWSLETEEHAKNLSDGLMFISGVLAAHFLKADILYGWDSDPASTSPLADSISDRALTLAFSGKTKDPSDNVVSAKLTSSFVLIPKEHQGPALLIRLKGMGAIVIPLKQVFLFSADEAFRNDLDNKAIPAGLRQEFANNHITLSAGAKVSIEDPGAKWEISDLDGALNFTLKLESEKVNVYVDEFSFKIIVDAPDAIIHIGEGGTNFPSSTDAAIGFSLNHKSAGEFRAIFGSPKATHLSFGETSLQGKLSTNDYSVRFGTKNNSFIISSDDADSFINKILPAGELKTEFDFALGYSKRRGFFIEGGAGFLVAIPLHKEIGPLNLQTLTLGLKVGSASSSSAVNLESSLSFSTKLGPLTATVDRIGLGSDFDFPEGGGNLGPVNAAVKFKPPTGIGLAIDGGGFKGGGFLSFDKENERYAGMLELEYQNRIELKAIGLLTTRLPGVATGFSLLIIITAEFEPIQLGLGFTLNGVGGLLGLNRTAHVERLRTGLRDNTLRSILFPENIIANADRIISDLRQVFPPQNGRFLFGPMAKIGWGSPTRITVDLGLLIEVPQPVRVFILGVARGLLPDEKAKLLKLQVNFLGEVDFERELFAFDASLFDSKLLTYTLSGDMAARLKWGDSDPNFLLTVGGFHPAYDPPPLGLPALRRLTVQMLKGNNPRLVLETYFAVTSNTAQFGARVELYAAAGKFNVYGFLSFDTLFQFNPFYFIADVSAMLALRVGSSSIASIQLALTLEGTTPWKAQGTATLKLCWFIKIKVRFNKTFGEVRDTRLDDVTVLPLLRAALSDKGNWSAGIPSGRHLLVSVKEIEGIGDQVSAHPFGVLEISQRAVPLNVEIQKFGNQRPADGNRFAIKQVQVGEPGDTETLGTSAVREQFAPAQFFEMTDAEKLSRKSFERYDGGVRVTASERLEAAYAVKREVEYDLFYIDSQRDQHLRPWFKPLRPEAVAFNAWASKGAVAASPLSFANNAKSALAPEAVQVIQEPFAVVNTSDLTPVNGAAVADSEAGAFGLMRELIRSNPALEGEIQVVPAFEVNRS